MRHGVIVSACRQIAEKVPKGVHQLVPFCDITDGMASTGNELIRFEWTGYRGEAVVDEMNELSVEGTYEIGIVANARPHVDLTDEYDGEARTILLRLHTANSENDILQIVHEEFVRWFNLSIAGPTELYSEAALEITVAWQIYGPAETFPSRRMTQERPEQLADL